jgi:hypothetical protein
MDDSLGTLRELFDELAENAGADTADSAAGCDYLRGGTAFATIDGDAAEVRLDPEIAEAVLRTPSTAASSRGAGWVRFAPPDFDQHARDRAEAWFLSAWRAAQRGEH